MIGAELVYWEQHNHETISLPVEAGLRVADSMKLMRSLHNREGMIDRHPPYSHGRRVASVPGRMGALCLILLFWAVAAPIASADEENRPHHPLQPADTSSPRATLNSFRSACDKAFRYIRDHGRTTSDERSVDYVTHQILYCLDLSQVPEYMRQFSGRESAVYLKEVLDRIELPLEHEIPDLEQIEQDSDKPPLTHWTIPNTEITIERIQEGPRQGNYVFSAATVDKVDDFYERVKHLPYQPGASEGFLEWYLSEPKSPLMSKFVHSLPEWIRTRVYGQAIWQWMGLALIILLAAAVMFAAYRAGRWKTGQSRQANLIRYCFSLALPIAAMLVPIIVKSFAEQQLVISGRALTVTRFSANLVFLFTVLVVLVGAGSRIAEIIIAQPNIHPRGVDAQFIRLACKASSLVAALIIFLEGGQYLGIPLTTLLAGAGVGGLAVALGAQDMLRNLFGSLMIILDKPYRVGERISVKEYDGVVEEIGLRSTKIRLLTGHLAVIPNEEMGRLDIENIGRRLHIRRVMDIAIPLDTPPEKVEESLRIARDIMQDHQGQQADFPPRIFFTDYNRDSLNLRIIYWYHPPEYWEFLAFSEQINLQLMREFEKAEIPFALPTSETIWAGQSSENGQKLPTAAPPTSSAATTSAGPDRIPKDSAVSDGAT